MKLYRWGLPSQYHYVVGVSFGDAEATIKTEYDNFGSGLSSVETLECLGAYVQVSTAAIMEGGDHR